MSNYIISEDEQNELLSIKKEIVDIMNKEIEKTKNILYGNIFKCFIYLIRYIDTNNESYYKRFMSIFRKISYDEQKELMYLLKKYYYIKKINKEEENQKVKMKGND